MAEEAIPDDARVFSISISPCITVGPPMCNMGLAYHNLTKDDVLEIEEEIMDDEEAQKALMIAANLVGDRLMETLGMESAERSGGDSAQRDRLKKRREERRKKKRPRQGGE